MDTIMSNVESLLKLDREARDNDMVLIYRYWHDIDKVPFALSKEDLIGKVTNPIIIIRCKERLMSITGGLL